MAESKAGARPRINHNQLHVGSAAKSLENGTLIKHHNRREKAPVEVPAEDGRRLQEAPLHFTQSPEAPADGVAEGDGYGGLNLSLDDPSIAAAGEGARPDCRSQELLDEEREPIGARLQQRLN
jgi:hypothetical protein